ncbi:MAG TPA: MAPEG family protein, partial [Microvirga sp.]|nr:MAPEG family protein [Microvirga sp.]
FYALVALALITRKADMLFVVMSWMFVVSRLVHAAIHVTSNKLSLRFMAFLVGVLILAAMWIIFAVRIFAAEAGV